MPIKRPEKPSLNPVKRIRDMVRYQKPQQNITFEEWKQIEARAAQGEAFMSPENEIYQMMLADLENAKDIILENRIKEVQEETVISTQTESTEQGGLALIPQYIKKFITPKKVQVDELIGQYKYVKTFLAEMKTWVDFKKELEHKEADGQITIQRNERSDV